MNHKRASVFLCICAGVLAALQTCTGQNNDVRKAVRAGQFYPADPYELSETIKNYLDAAEIVNINGVVEGMFVPHAGYEFSGRVAASGFRQIEGSSYDLVVIIGTAHYKGISGAAVGDWQAFETPLGNVQVDTASARAIAKENKIVEIDRKAHLYEHSIEVQLPFLKTVLPEVPIVPVVVGRVSYGDARNIARAILKHTRGRKVLYIASSDMSHYPDYRNAYEVDLKMLDEIRKADPKGVIRLNNELMRKGIPNLECTMCGLSAVVTLIIIANDIHADNVHMLPYMNSGDLTGERNRVVGYGSAIFYNEIKKPAKEINSSGPGAEGRTMEEGISFTNEEKKTLFKIARKSIKAALEKQSIPQFDISDEHLTLKRGVFVTLTNHGRLRGCIGHFGADMELWEIVSKIAVAAATQDYRFAYDPVTAEEMADIDIKISILSPLRKIDSIDEIEVGTHGIWIKQGMQSGTYLPEVATEMGWNRDEFLRHCAVEKAGLNPNTWQDDAEIYIYSSQVLSENKF